MKKKIEVGTIARTVVLIFALANQMLTMGGYNPLPFSDEAVYEGITMVLTVAASLCAWWSNNSFSQKAIEADEQLHNKGK